MNKILVLAQALVLVAVAGSASGQDRRDDQDKNKPDVKRTDARAADPGRPALVLKTPDLLGKQIKNRQGTHLGYLDDLVIDEGGRVAYAVLNNRDSAVTTGKMFALPLNAFSAGDDLKYLVLDSDKEFFTNAEGFDNNHWPMHADAKWTKNRPGAPNEPRKDNEARKDDKDVKRDEKPGREADQTPRTQLSGSDHRDHAKHLARITAINGMSVKNERGDDLGKIQGFAVDVTNQKVIYAALGYGGVAGVGSKYFAIPWEAMECKSLNLRPQDKCFVVKATKDEFESATGFDKNSWPVQADQRFMKGDRRDNLNKEKDRRDNLNKDNPNRDKDK